MLSAPSTPPGKIRNLTSPSVAARHSVPICCRALYQLEPLGASVAIVILVAPAASSGTAVPDTAATNMTAIATDEIRTLIPIIAVLLLETAHPYVT